MPKLTLKQHGENQQVDLSVEVYREAADAGRSVRDHINLTYPTDAQAEGTAFEQFLARAGLFQHANAAAGIKPPTMHDIVHGNAVMSTEGLQAGTIVRDAQPASRILFPAVVLEAINSTIGYDAGSYLGIFENMIAIKDTVAGNRIEQPVINYSGIGNTPGSVVRSQPISQASYPASMVTITTSDIAKKIPTLSLGLEITDEALKATSLPLVTLALTRQSEMEKIARTDEFLQSFIWGDKDVGMAALPAVVPSWGGAGALVCRAKDLDPAIAASADLNTLTHKAWVRWLRRNFRRRHIDYVMCTVATALAIESRTGRPNYQAQDSDAKLIRPVPAILNPQWADVGMFLVEDGTLPDGVVVGIDSRYALRRVRNSEADYTAVEQFVLKKTQAMRFDFGEIMFRLMDEAWDVLVLGDNALPADPRT